MRGITLTGGWSFLRTPRKRVFVFGSVKMHMERLQKRLQPISVVCCRWTIRDWTHLLRIFSSDARKLVHLCSRLQGRDQNRAGPSKPQQAPNTHPSKRPVSVSVGRHPRFHIDTWMRLHKDPWFRTELSLQDHPRFQRQRVCLLFRSFSWWRFQTKQDVSDMWGDRQITQQSAKTHF